MNVKALCLLACLALWLPAFSQEPITVSGLLRSVNAYQRGMPAERLYVQTDRSSYAPGDTLQLKAYLLDNFLAYSKQSGIIYLECVTDSNKVVFRRAMPAAYGLGAASVVLDANTFTDGGYTLRAYTNWMRNFGDRNVFERSFVVSSAKDDNWLVRTRSRTSKDTADVRLTLTDLKGMYVGFRELKIAAKNGKSTLFQDDVKTQADGTLDLRFNLPRNTPARDLTLVVKDARKNAGNRTLTFPVTADRPENTDIQFMPEGGTLLAGGEQVIGVKAIGESGHGVSVAGKVVSSDNEEVAVLKTTHNGMGSFVLKTRPGFTYAAKVTLPGGIVKTYPLPAPATAGTTLSVEDPGSDSLTVRITGSDDKHGQSFYLVGQTRGIACYGARMVLRREAALKVPKNAFPTGVARFTLFDGQQLPQNERQIFIDHDDALSIAVATTRTSFSTRDSVGLELTVTDADGKPVQGSFSLAVTDDSQSRADGAGGSILVHMLLSADLHGEIEEPGYYFSGKPGSKQALDDLLLTQGWAGYDWKQVFAPPKAPAHIAEPELAIRGKVVGLLNKGAANAPVIATSLRPLYIRDTISDAAGNFVFKGLPVADTLAFLVQARNKRNKSFGVDVVLDEFVPPVFSVGRAVAPWFVNADTAAMKIISSQLVAARSRQVIPGGSRVLNEVTLIGAKAVRNSHNLNGAGGADIVIDESELQRASVKATLFDVLSARFKTGFYKGSVHDAATNTLLPAYYLKGMKVRLVIDGLSISKLYNPDPFTNPDGDAFEQTDFLMNYLQASDIRGVEIMNTSKHALAYDPDYIHKQVIAKTKDIPVYLEITTYSGNGAFIKHTPGMTMFRPVPYVMAKKFYSPRYTSRDVTSGTPRDYRATIFWDPFVVTDVNGKARIGFYSSDRTGTYTFVLEGATLAGALGSYTGKITVK